MTDPTPVVLAVLALLLAGPAPAALAKAQWPVTAPRAALVLWQALALAALLSALGAGASLGLLPVVDRADTPWSAAAHIAVLTLTVVVALRLLWTASRLAVRVRHHRQRHRTAVDLLGRIDDRAPGARVLDLDHPLAYCVPGSRPRVVVSEATLQALSPAEMQAVLEHERAHVRARHDLVLEGFRALHEAFPRWVRSRAALDAAAALIEMLADDAARARTGPRPLARALVALASSPVPDGALGTGSIAALARLRRLSTPAGTRQGWLSAGAYLIAAAVVVVPTVMVALPWLQRVAAALA